ncbi:MAG: peptide-methionine (R)-S-oxide reductase MsrB [Candidatus Binatia bacterium]|nr:peptide-methionine (R)-S-oxide reductase MsrB [Candidatus Binatia bacterium]MDG2009118.1 peptide-methionine (R)-S-oxide reductase MsrB [Candidatus Binatia bacterium]HAC78685.1 peptide-methionine (R)-S-oxide reductase [Deltaproteobacteria bacterium]
MTRKIQKSEQEWRETLTPEQYAVCRQKGTERAFTGTYCDHHEKGAYLCAACGEALFRSESKFESGSGWPSFYEPANLEMVEEEQDHSHGMVRTEVLCRNCGSHLGHVFPDGPQPTGQRFCINSLSLGFAPDEGQQD